MASVTKQQIASVLARQGILIAFAVFMIAFTLANPKFLSVENVSSVVRSSAILGVMALGVTFVVISGNLDLSVGSMMSFSTIVVLDLHDRIGPLLAIPAMFGMTLCLGAFIGFLVGYLRLNSLIVTLGMLSAIHGLTLTYSGGKNMDIADKEGTWFSVFGQGAVFGIPLPILILVALAAILGIVLAKTPFGRKVYAVGVGAGRTEIAETLFGLRDPSAGQILLDGEVIRIHSPTDAIARGISLVPEDRKGQGLILGMNCRDNMTLPQVDDLKAGPFVAEGAEIAIFDQYRDRLDIRTPSWKARAGNLSGGNQQKIVIGKWLSMHPKVLIVDEPTRGIDVGSKSEIHKLLRELAAQGYAVMVISSEMPEVLHVSDRIVAMYSGRIMRTFTSEEVTEDNLIQAISGIKSGQAA